MSAKPVVTCADCGHTFESEWTHEEAQAELKKSFGDVPLNGCDILCNFCYERLMAGRN
jgi:hypothetical protein